MTYDYVIVGAGSAGCVLANRLSANPAHRVLLLEAGGRDWHPFIHMPAGLAKLVNNKRINWDYYTEPEAALAHRRLWWPRGKVLGGSSSINAMCYTRGAPGDYDEWAAATGDPRWAWNARAAGVQARRRQHARRGRIARRRRSARRCRTCAITTCCPTSSSTPPPTAGFARNADFNGATQEGFGFYQVTQKNGARCSAATAYLAPVRAAREPDGADARADHARAARRRARGRRRIPPSRPRSCAPKPAA